MPEQPDLTFNFIGVTVVDWLHAFAFFTQTLGLHAELNPQHGDWANLGGGWDGYYTGNRSAVFELFDGGRAVENRHWGHHQGIRPGFQVANLAQMVGMLTKRGVAVEETVSHPWGQSAEFTTAEGIRFALAHIPGRPTSDDLARPFIGHVALKCADLPAMKRFYRQALGFHQSAEGADYAIFSQADDHPQIILTTGGAPDRFEPSQSKWADDPVRAYPVFLSMMTPDVQAVSEHLAKHNVHILRGIVSHDDWGGTDMHIADPDGNPIQIVHYH